VGSGQISYPVSRHSLFMSAKLNAHLITGGVKWLEGLETRCACGRLGWVFPARPTPEKTQSSLRRLDVARASGAGFLEEAGKLIVVAEDDLSSSWVRNALDKGGQLRVFLHGKWRDARLAPRSSDPEV